MKEIAPICLGSILENTNTNICIGYIREEDIEFFPRDSRLTFINLQEHARVLGLNLFPSGYVDYTKEEFFKLVQLKWDLLDICLKSFDSHWVIYSDFDVIWLQNAVRPIIDTFNSNQNLDLVIQNNSMDPSRRSLCMGFVAMRNNTKVLDSLIRLKRVHATELEKNPFIGDDGIISDYLLGQRSEMKFLELPQGGFPTGNYSNLLTKFDLFPGLTSPKPFILHANYVIGERKKTLLLFLSSRKNPEIRALFSRKQILLFRAELCARRVKSVGSYVLRK